MAGRARRAPRRASPPSAPPRRALPSAGEVGQDALAAPDDQAGDVGHRAAGQGALRPPLPPARRRPARPADSSPGPRPGRAPAGPRGRRRRRRAAAPPPSSASGGSFTTPARIVASSRSSANSCAPARIRSTSAASGAAAGRGSRVSTRSIASSAERALSRSRRSVNWVVSSERRSSSPLRRTSSAASAVGSVTPWRISVARQPHPEQAEPLDQPGPGVGVQGRTPAARTNRSTDSSIAVELGAAAARPAR